MLCSLLVRLQEKLNLSFQCSENTKCQCNIEDDSGKSWSDATIESKRSIIFQDMFRAVGESVELVGVDTLHLRLNNINRVVAVDRDGAGQATGDQIADHLGVDVVRQEFGGVSVHQESHTLVGRLFQKGGGVPFVNTSNTVSLDNFTDTVENVSVLRIWHHLVVHELRLDCLLRRHDEGRLGGTGD